MYALEILMTLVIVSALEGGCFWFLSCMAGLGRTETHSSTVSPKTKRSTTSKPPSLQCLDRSCEPEPLGGFLYTVVAGQLPSLQLSAELRRKLDSSLTEKLDF